MGARETSESLKPQRTENCPTRIGGKDQEAQASNGGQTARSTRSGAQNCVSRCERNNAVRIGVGSARKPEREWAGIVSVTVMEIRPGHGRVSGTRGPSRALQHARLR
jgi:hypothetical protein